MQNVHDVGVQRCMMNNLTSVNNSSCLQVTALQRGIAEKGNV